jgi:hypothetical protein
VKGLTRLTITIWHDEVADGAELVEEADVMVDECGERSIGELLSIDLAELRAWLLVVEGPIVVCGRERRQTETGVDGHRDYTLSTRPLDVARPPT